MDPVTPELEIIRGQLKDVGIDVTVGQLRELSIADRVVAEQWAILTKQAKASGSKAPSFPPVVKQWCIG